MEATKDEVAQPANSTLTPAEARTILETEAQAKAQRFNNGLVNLAKETGYAVAPAVIFPNGEIVLLASYLKAHNIQLTPTIQIIKNG